MLWRVQSAWSGGLHTGFAGIEEHLAKRDVGRLIGQWMISNLEKMMALLSGKPGSRAFVLEGQLLRESLLSYLSQGNVWEAYDWLHRFQDRFAEQFSNPIWVAMGTVIVEAPPGKGPATRKRFLTPDDFPENLRPSLGSSGAPRGLGALRRWKISSHGFGKLEDAVFLKQEEAIAYLGQLLEALAHKLHAHASAEALANVSDERSHYADEAIQIVFQITDLVKSGHSILALDRWRDLESAYRNLFPWPTLRDLVGDITVTIDPPFSMHGALKRWKIYVQTPGEAIEESTHVIEADAMAYAKRALDDLLARAIFQVEVWQDSLYRRDDDYLVNFQGAIDFTMAKLERGAVKEAIECWMGFQAYDSQFEAEGNLVGPPPVVPLIGMLVVENS